MKLPDILKMYSMATTLVHISLQRFVPNGLERNAPQDTLYTSGIRNPRDIESSNTGVNCTTLRSKDFDSYNTLAALNALHVLIDTH